MMQLRQINTTDNRPTELLRPSVISGNRKIITGYEHDLYKIISCLLDLNMRYGYTTFWDFSGHINQFNIRIFEGWWNWKSPVMTQVHLEIIDSVLYDLHHCEIFNMGMFTDYCKYLIEHSKDKPKTIIYG